MASSDTPARTTSPPTSTLPQLTVSKLRSPSSIPESSRISSAPPSTSKLALRTPSKIVKLAPLNASHAASSPNIPTLASMSTRKDGENAKDHESGDQVRRSVSIANFPQPPKARKPERGSRSSADTDLMQSTRPATSRASSLRVKKLKTKASTGSLNQMYSCGATPSLLNNSGDGKAIFGSAMRRESSGLASVHSPGHSRSSSAQDSQSTSATTFEDNDEKRESEERKRGRDSGSKDQESRGNVIVSVRVRPDAGGDKSSGRDWQVDARRSLVAYKGREGGEYHYGELPCPFDPPLSQAIRVPCRADNSAPSCGARDGF